MGLGWLTSLSLRGAAVFRGGTKREAERGEWAEMAQDEGERKRMLDRQREEERESEAVRSRETLGGTAWLGENPQGEPGKQNCGKREKVEERE